MWIRKTAFGKQPKNYERMDSSETKVNITYATESRGDERRGDNYLLRESVQSEKSSEQKDRAKAS